jgi:hypothetical protein
MRLMRRALLAAAMTTTLPCAGAPVAGLAPASARAARAIDARLAGAVQAPQASLTGGSEYGVLPSVSVGPTPVVSLLQVPSTAPAGAPPVVRLRIASTHRGTYRVRVVVFARSVHEPLLAVDMGWVRSAHTVSVRWPRGARLRPGTYQLAVGVHGHRTGPARLFAHSARVTTITVTARAGVPAPLPQLRPLPPGVPTPAQSAAMGAVFPVAGPHNFGDSESRFGAPRSGHVHEGQDVLTAEGTPIVAPLAGTVIDASFQAGGAGYYVAEHTAAGLDFFFAHCKEGSVAVKTGQSLGAGASVCAAGQTGDATTPHLHFEIWVGGWQAKGGFPIDPLPYLEAWDHG